METIKKHVAKVLVIATAFALGIGMNYLYAWTSPTGAPPANNVSAPINVGNTNQVKGGGLGVGAFTADDTTITGVLNWGAVSAVSSLANDQGGNIELGGTNSVKNPTTSGQPYIDFHYGTGAAQDYNTRIINSASNQLTISTQSGGNVFTVNGSNVGIGTTNPSTKLEVNGGIAISNLSGALTLGRNDNINEGGQMSFTGAGAYDNWTVDSYQNNLRVFTSSASADQVQIMNAGSGGATLSVEGVVQSTVGGFKFPDGTTQTTAAAGGGVTVDGGGFIAQNSSANLGSTFKVATFGAQCFCGGGDDKGPGFQIYKSGANYVAQLASSAQNHASVTVNSSLQCSSGATTVGGEGDICVQLSGSSVVVYTGNHVQVTYVMFH